jgi:glucokinase
MSENWFLGVDLGGTKMAVSLWAEDSNHKTVIKKGVMRWPTTSDGPESNLEQIAQGAEKLLDAARAAPREGAGEGAAVEGHLVSVGISGGGPVDPVRGVILSIPNLPGWDDVPVGSWLSTRLGVPAFLENDANASAVAEWLYGAGKGSNCMAFLTCSTGIGAGLILDGRLYRGARFLAGEAGHQVIVPGGLPCGCGKQGCLEAYASGSGMARRLEVHRMKDPSLPCTAREVVERAREGEVFSLQFLRETAEYLAMGIVNLVFILDLERVVLGTIAVGAGDLLLGPLRESLSRRLWPSFLRGLEVVPAALGSELGDHAAIAVARDLPRVLRC